MTTSVVMPVHGNWAITRRALDALETRLGRGREVIVVDDASPEAAPDGLPGAIIRNEENLGFGPSCNRGAAQARGTHLLFLNSDAIVEPGALDALESASECADVGAVAPFLLDEDGTIQEAGSALGRDGLPYPLGAGAPAGDAEWSFRREVDYGFAACLLVRRDTFDELGGFDDAYAPGYYEDADLCLRLAERGLATVFEPRARVVHLQWSSGGRDRARALARRNQGQFLKRWGRRLAHRPVVVASEPWPHRRLALRDALTLLRFLVVEDAQLATELASNRPAARVTLIGANRVDGVETARPEDLAGWLRERRFHYSAVLGTTERIDDALLRWQPQAARTLDDPVIPPIGAEPRG